MAIETRKRLSRSILSSNGFLGAVVVLLCLLAFSYAVHMWFDHDEFEHIHSAWYVANGYTPYADFFQNHHPLLWYCLAPLLLLLGYSTQTVVILRIAFFGLTMGIAFLTFLIARRVTSSTTASLLSVLLLLSMLMFLEKSIEIRPDVPQVLLGLVSVYFFMGFLQTQKNRHLVLAGVCASFSFLFLQKTSFLLIAYALILCYGLVRRRIPARAAVYFAVSFSLPVVLFLGYLLLSGAIGDYVLTNWLLHTEQLMPYSPLMHPIRSFKTQNALFWLLALISVGFVLLSRKTDPTLKATAFLGTALLLSILLLKRPHRQNYMFATPLLCIPVGYALERAAARFRLNGFYLGLLVILVLVQPVASLAPRIVDSTRRDYQLAVVDFVLDNTTVSDQVYDGDIQFNLFRRDLHYFWFSVGQNKGLDTYNAITNNKYGDYDICQLVRSQQPQLISYYELRPAKCGLRPFYDDTPFSGLYVRNDELEGQHLLWRNLGDSVALIGYEMETVAGQDEDVLHLTLWWRSLAKMDTDYTLFIHVLAPEGHIWAQQDSLLLSGRRPTSAWRVGETVERQYDLSLPTGTTSADRILVGLYYSETGERLPVWDERGQRVTNDAVLLPP